jgi:hypothetical protein
MRVYEAQQEKTDGDKAKEKAQVRGEGVGRGLNYTPPGGAAGVEQVGRSGDVRTGRRLRTVGPLARVAPKSEPRGSSSSSLPQEM